MEQARRIRQLAAQKVGVEAIAARLFIRPAVVRRVLGRSARRGAPRKRPASAILSFVTTLDLAQRLRALAKAQGTPLSTVLEELVRRALLDPEQPAGPSAAAGLRPFSRTGRRARRRPAKPQPGRPRPPATAADAPTYVRALLKSYELEELRWRLPRHRYEIVAAILTRGNEKARKWLSTVLSHAEVRELVRRFRAAGCSEPERKLLREELALSEADLPPRAYLGFERESSA